MLVGIGGVQSAAEKAAVVAFQQSGSGQLPMAPHGHPDANTLINMGQYTPMEYWPNSQAKYLTTGEEPGTFFRDLSGVNNQVPRWAWFTVGGVFLLLSGLSYRKHRKDKRKKK